MLALGIDIGGTSIKCGVVNDKGHLLNKFVMSVQKAEKQDITIDKLMDLIEEHFSKNNYDEPISGIGIGIPGLIDVANGLVRESPNLKWQNLKIVEIFEKRFKTRIKITNDANAAAYGETIFGAGNKYSDTIELTLGTGVGGGVVINRKLYEGFGGFGTELGHMVIKFDGEECACGRKGCLEAYASATALVRDTKRAMEADKQSLMWEIANKLGKVSGRVPFEAAKLGDSTAEKVVSNYVYYLATGVINLLHIFRPQCVLLSGGVANQGQYLIDRLDKECAKQNYGFKSAPKPEFKIAELGYDSGIIGAACLILNQ